MLVIPGSGLMFRVDAAVSNNDSSTSAEIVPQSVSSSTLSDEEEVDTENDSDDVDLVPLPNEHLSKGSQMVIRAALNILTEYTRRKGCTLSQLDQMAPEDLDQFLAVFYAEARTTNGSPYARNTMMTLRYGLQQHFKFASGLDSYQQAGICVVKPCVFGRVGEAEGD